MNILRMIAGGLETNGYIVYDSNSSKGIVIDPEGEAAPFIEKMDALSIKIEAIILTHHHYDHRGAVEDIKKKINCALLIHEKDKEILPLKVDGILREGDFIRFGNDFLKVIHTPGHTKGSICLVNDNETIAFTGDTIFNVDLGRTDLQDGSQDEMRSSIKNKIDKWQNDMTIYPGHGDSCTMEFVRKNNWEYKEIIEN